MYTETGSECDDSEVHVLHEKCTPFQCSRVQCNVQLCTKLILQSSSSAFHIHDATSHTLTGQQCRGTADGVYLSNENQKGKK